MKEAKPSEGKRVHPLTKIGYFLLTQGNRYANSFILLTGFALSGAFFVLGVNYVAPAFSYASRVNEALRQGIGSRRGFLCFYACFAWELWCFALWWA